ncbi:MAG: AMP-binding protein [Cytophagales bacterium]|nr:AMP-binding protein [Cytophagales bacterium]
MGKINQKIIAEQDRYVLNFIKRWPTGKPCYEFHTSGSTGLPRTIELSKEQLTYSAQQTLKYLFEKSTPQKLLLCLDPRFIGGTQVITRALISNADLRIIPQSANPIKELNEPMDLASLVPMQIETILSESPDKFAMLKHVLIGGAELKQNLIQELSKINTTKFYQTYGMTETASHIAIKPINEDLFRPLGNLQLTLDNRGCLKIKGTVTNAKWVQTNDIINEETNGFRWLGRADWVINSGGIKISPENIERKINKRWPSHTVIVSSISDDRLGEKIVLITNNPILKEIESVSFLSRYERPKNEYILREWPRNEGGKIDRKELQHWVRNQHDKPA